MISVLQYRYKDPDGYIIKKETEVKLMHEYEKQTVTTQALRRMPYYIQQLRILHNDKIDTVSAPRIAELLSLNEVQVRKDFAAVSSSKGKPKAGFSVIELLSNMEELLGYHNVDEAVLVGTGPLAQAVITHESFLQYGLKVVAAFSMANESVEAQLYDIKVLPSDKISNLCRRLKIKIGIITVPASQAQIVCDQLVAGGVVAIWNFAPIHLSVPDFVVVQNENFSASIALLSKHVKKSMKVPM